MASVPKTTPASKSQASPVVTMCQTPTGWVLRWVQEGQVLHLVGKVPEVWLDVLRKEGYTVQQGA